LGSVAPDEAGDDGDVDILVELAPSARIAAAPAGLGGRAVLMLT